MAVNHSSYISHLSKDKKLARLLEGREPFILSKRRHIYLHLCNSIMGQQLSTKVAATIRKRFYEIISWNTKPGTDSFNAS